MLQQFQIATNVILHFQSRPFRDNETYERWYWIPEKQTWSASLLYFCIQSTT